MEQAPRFHSVSMICSSNLVNFGGLIFDNGNYVQSTISIVRLQAFSRSCSDTIVLMIPKVRKAVFPAAGLGTRFLPATKAQPKEMLPLVDKPLIQYGVEEAIHSGVQNIIIVTGRGKVAIEDHFDVAFELEHLLETRNKKDLLATVRSVSDLIDISYVRQKEAL